MTVPRSGAHFTPLLHENVTETERIHPTVRRFRCLDCGLTWEDNSTSSQLTLEDVKPEEDLHDYFPEYETCKEQK